MNLLELRTEIRRMLRESSATRSAHTDTDLNKYINEGIKDICIKASIFEKTASQTILTTVATYTCPYDFLKCFALKNPSGVSLEPITPIEAGSKYIISGKPLYFFVSQSSFSPTVRVNSTIYSKGTILVPAAANGYLYEVTVTGQTGGAPPTYPLVSGTAVADGTATIVCRELITSLYSLTLVDTPTTAGGGTGNYSLIYSALDEGLYVDTDVPNFPWDKHHFLCDFGCFRALQSVRQMKDAIPFIMSYAANLGLDASQYLGGQPQQ